MKRIGKRCEPIQKAPKPLQDLETTVDYGVQQYGRHMYRWCIEHSRKHDLPFEFVVNSLIKRMQSRLRDEDMDWLLGGVPEQEASKIKKELRASADEVARAQELGWWSE